MSELMLYRCDSCGREEAPGPRVVGWIAFTMASMVLPSQRSGRKHLESEYCSEVCAKVGLATHGITLDRLPWPDTETKLPDILGDAPKALLGQYL